MAKLDFSGSNTDPGKLDFSNPDGGITDWFQGFGRSAIESLPELIGIDPSEKTRQWRQDNPIGGFTSEIAGTAVPYLGWFKAAKMIKPLAKAAELAGGVSKNAFVSGAASSAATLLPFEAGRVAANQAVGDQPLSHMLGATATDLALGSGIGGLLHGIASAGTRDPRLPSIFPGLDVALPTPLMARQMRSIIDSGKLTDPDMIGRANAALKDTLARARSEELPASQKYIGPINHPTVQNTEDFERTLNRLFRGGTGEVGSQSMITRRFVAGDRNFPTDERWTWQAKEAGLPEGFEEHGQFFRDLSFNAGAMNPNIKNSPAVARKRADNINELLTKNMENVGDGNFLVREADDGMFVIARKYEGKPTKGDPKDRWVLFKTDKPGYFLPAQDRFAALQVKLGSWNPQSVVSADAGPVYNSTKGYIQQFPLTDWTTMLKAGKMQEVVQSLLPKNIVGKSNEVVSRLGDAVSEYLAPRIMQFKKSARANWIVNGAKIASDSAETTANKLLFGEVRVDPGRNLFFRTLQGAPEGIDGLQPAKAVFDQAGDAGVREFTEKIWRNNVPPNQLHQMMLDGQISPETEKFGRAMEAINDWRNVTRQKVEVATGRPPTETPTGLYGLPRQWEGDTRIILVDDSGKVVAHAGGVTRKLAQKNAEKMLAKNPTWRIEQEVSESQDPAGVAKWLGGQDTRYLKNQKLKGFKWDQELPTKEELFKDYEEAVKRDMAYQANLSVGDMFSTDMSRLMSEDPSAYRMVKARLNDYAGVKSDFSKWQNNIADKILAPVVGTNSASKIVAATNTAMFDLTLGAMKLAYPVVNALQFVQTVVPEAAFVLGKAPAEELAHKYNFFAAGGSKGPVGSLAVLNPLKMQFSAMKEMAKPSRELSSAMERAMNERVLAPRVVEDYVGASATKVSNLRGMLKGEDSFVGWLRALSEFLPAESERLSRTHAFTVGYGIARDFLRSAKGDPLNSEQLYSFARQFTENTMYLYSTADRPRIFTTPAGSALGLFKNWMFHYLATMGEYSKQGFVKGNFAPLLWQTGGTIGLGGLAATPLVGVADQFVKSWSDKSILQQAYNHFDQNADYVMYGLPALAGLSMSSSVDTPAVSNPVRDASSLFSVAAWGRVKSLGTAAKAAIDHWQATGEHPGYNREVREDLIKSFAPVTMYRSIGAFANPEAIASVGTGYPLMKDPSVVQRLLYATGFNPLELQRGYDISKEVYETHNTLKLHEKMLGKQWAQAEMEGNTAQMSTIMRQGIVWGVDIGRVIKEGTYEIGKYRKDIIERQLKPRDIGAWRKTQLGGVEE